ncbi:hypothetical protein [Aquibium oceanicum]|uniref:Uncharacterized protein n=1 Tax=Aquibium oceanicum TaxID=1670800 RepID=A0A1L3SXJ3_9HYPH|nr:hypothetical protein [Aquibium oceanicum]APH74146.1 hypothetical protein BSQ44_24315 [Aquibium oceanicum]
MKRAIPFQPTVPPLMGDHRTIVTAVELMEITPNELWIVNYTAHDQPARTHVTLPADPHVLRRLGNELIDKANAVLTRRAA